MFSDFNNGEIIHQFHFVKSLGTRVVSKLCTICYEVHMRDSINLGQS